MAVFENVCSTHKDREAGETCIVSLSCVIQKQTAGETSIQTMSLLYKISSVA